MVFAPSESWSALRCTLSSERIDLFEIDVNKGEPYSRIGRIQDLYRSNLVDLSDPHVSFAMYRMIVILLLAFRTASVIWWSSLR